MKLKTLIAILSAFQLINLNAQTILKEKTINKTIDNIYFEVDIVKRNNVNDRYSYFITAKNLKKNSILTLKSFHNKYPMKINELITMEDFDFDGVKEIVLLERTTITIHERTYGQQYTYGYFSENSFSSIDISRGNYKLNKTDKTLIIDDGHNTISTYKYVFDKNKSGTQQKSGRYYLVKKYWENWKYK
jgi:hypothetical protein